MPVHRVPEENLEHRLRELEASGENVVTMMPSTLNPSEIVILTSKAGVTR